MPGKALSKLKKRSCHHKEQDKRFRNSTSLWKKKIQDWETEVAAHPDANTHRPSMRQFSKAHNINRATLANYANDTHITKAKSGQMRQKLSPEEEDVLVNAVINQGHRGFPLTHDRVERIANSIIICQKGINEAVGKNWVERFLARHEDRLHTYWTKHLPSNRDGAVNPANVRSWEDILEEEVVIPGIQPEDMYGMDETHMPPEFTQMRQVISGKGKSVQYKQGGSTRQTITILATICANGISLQPNIIFKASRHVPEWFDDNVANAT
jgi:hypothetical protein